MRTALVSLGDMPAFPILVVQHQATCPPGWLGGWLTDAGAVLDVRHPYAGQQLPGDLADHGGLVILGGSMGADDDAVIPWLRATKVLIREAAADGIPTLGICLGHQLAAVALGGAVEVNPAGAQTGVLDVGWLPAAAEDELLAGCGSRAVQWNDDIVSELPSGTTVLARAAAGELQAARFAPTVWGLQWHPEAGGDLVRKWAEVDRAAAPARATQIDDRLLEVERADEKLRQDWRPLATNFAALTHRQP